MNPPEIENKIDLLYSNFSVNTQRSVREPVKNNSRELLDFEYWESKIIETVKKVL
jgi:hypothetical protein